MRTIPSNITRKETRYPIPSHWYGSGWFWIEQVADDAYRKRHAARSEAEPPPPVPEPPLPDWKIATCEVCGVTYEKYSAPQRYCYDCGPKARASSRVEQQRRRRKDGMRAKGVAA